MTKPANWIYAQSAVLAYRLRNDVVEILVITSREGKRWVLPKGMIEPGMTAAASAAKEAMEEAGVEGPVMAQGLGTYRRRKWRGICEVEVFPMKVTRELDRWPESSFRHREWVTLEEAEKRLDPAELRAILRRLPAAVEGAGDGDYAAIGRPSRLIYLLRHAKSSWADPSLADFDRPLAPRGERASTAMGQYLRQADLRPDVVLCSSSARTRETLARVLPALGGDIPVEYEKALYHAGAGALMDRLRRVPDQYNAVMVIGHNPGLHDLALALAATAGTDAMARLEAKFPTAGLATLVLRQDHWRDLAPGSCELYGFVVPRQLEA